MIKYFTIILLLVIGFIPVISAELHISNDFSDWSGTTQGDIYVLDGNVVINNTSTDSYIISSLRTVGDSISIYASPTSQTSVYTNAVIGIGRGNISSNGYNNVDYGMLFRMTNAQNTFTIQSIYESGTNVRTISQPTLDYNLEYAGVRINSNGTVEYIVDNVIVKTTQITLNSGESFYFIIATQLGDSVINTITASNDLYNFGTYTRDVQAGNTVYINPYNDVNDQIRIINVTSTSATISNSSNDQLVFNAENTFYNDVINFQYTIENKLGETETLNIVINIIELITHIDTGLFMLMLAVAILSIPLSFKFNGMFLMITVVIFFIISIMLFNSYDVITLTTIVFSDETIIINNCLICSQHLYLGWIFFGMAVIMSIAVFFEQFRHYSGWRYNKG